MRWLIATSLLGVGGLTADSANAADEPGFSKNVAPVLMQHCGGCHVRGSKGGFRMQSFDGLMKSGHVQAGNSAGSTLVSLIESGDMPPRGSVPKEQLAVLRQWIDAGAKFDGPDPTASLTATKPSARPSSGGYSGDGGDDEDYGEDDSMDDYGDDYGDDDSSMDDYSGDGEDYSGDGDPYAAGPAGRRGTGNPFVDLLASKMGGLQPASAVLLSTGQDIPTGPALLRESEEAFVSGNLPLALQLYFGHLVAEFEDATEAYTQVKFNAALRRPVWHIRWGVSFAARGDEEITDFQPIEPGTSSDRLVMRRPGGMRGGMRGGRGFGGGGDEGYGEDYGQEDYGDDSGGGDDEVMEDYADYGDEGMEAGPATPRAETPAAPVKVSMLDDAVRERIEKVLGQVARELEAAFAERYQRGDFGVALTGIEEPAEGSFRGTPAPASDTPMWTPGIVFCGEAPWQETVKQAQEQGLDLLFHFDIGVRPSREDIVQNISRCRLIHVPTESTVIVSKAFDNLEAARLAEFDRSTESEYIQEQFQNLLDVIDGKLVSVPMPRLSAENARKRVGSIIGASGNGILRALAEIRLYQLQGVLTAAEVETAFDILAGDEGLVLLYGPEEDRRNVARKLAAGQ